MGPPPHGGTHGAEVGTVEDDDMTWVLIGVGWLLVAALVGLLLGGAVRLADRHEPTAPSGADQPDVVDDVPEFRATSDHDTVRAFPPRPRGPARSSWHPASGPRRGRR